MGGWTGTGQKIQPLSKQCQSYVKGLSKKRSCRGFVPSVSKSGQSSVEPVSSLRSFGHRLDIKIHCVSKPCPHEFKIMPILALDSIWTYLGPWKKCSGVTLWAFEIPKLNIGQRLDKLWTWTDFGHSVDFCQKHLFTRSLLTAQWTNSGQILDMDKLWTNTRHEQTLDKLWIPLIVPYDSISAYWTNSWPTLDMDKLLTKFGFC